MDDNRLYIKNMVCQRCIMTVRDILARCGIVPHGVELGVVALEAPLDADLRGKLRGLLEEYGFELLEDSRMRCVERIRVGVIEYVRDTTGLHDRINLSGYLQDKCHREYSLLSKLFTEVKGVTIERYCILQKVEFVKELLFYGELTVSEIADRLDYSSPAHLSSQFKSVTGLSPTQFRKMKDVRLTPIDKI